MYRVLIADDEGIMLESLRTIINRNFPDCEVETAKSGRAAIEQAEVFHPDIVLMDIQMPGINGIEAMKEIRKFNSVAKFYIISAYDKFDYAQDAISLGVERYIMKPVTKSAVIEIITEGCRKVDEMRRVRSDQLKVQEKLETIIPVVENGFISSMLLQDDWQESGYYKQMLDISEDYAYVVLFMFGSRQENGELVGSVGMSVQAQNLYPEFRAVVKSFMRCVIGPIMTDKVTVVVPASEDSFSYEQRIQVIDQTRAIVARLGERLPLAFRAGIGRVRKLEELRASYREALQALREAGGSVVHTSDVVSRGTYEGDFPAELERRMFQMLVRGDTEQMNRCANTFFDWMTMHFPRSRDNIRLKVLEYVLEAEKDAFREGAVNYGFELRENYLTEVMSFTDYEMLRTWFIDKMDAACQSIHDRKKTQSGTVVSKAREYIQENFRKEISLDDVSREVNVSPYYFSKLFKEESGENFIEYLTRLRIDEARTLLESRDMSIKEIGIQVGYSDPNYFSRIFKKQTGMTPREYREQQDALF